MGPWQAEAACAGEDPRRFFEPAEPDEKGKVQLDEPGLALARSFCFRCPVRAECLASSMAAEDGSAEMFRFGVWGGTTGPQRASLWRRGRESWRCRTCGGPLDPRLLITGDRWCDVCGADGLQAPVSDLGDQWADRHTRLAREVIGWVVREFSPGDEVPSPTRYARERGVRKDDCTRVWRALCEDGILEQVARGRYVRLPGVGALRPRGRAVRRVPVVLAAPARTGP